MMTVVPLRTGKRKAGERRKAHGALNTNFGHTAELLVAVVLADVEPIGFRLRANRADPAVQVDWLDVASLTTLLCVLWISHASLICVRQAHPTAKCS